MFILDKIEEEGFLDDFKRILSEIERVWEGGKTGVEEIRTLLSEIEPHQLGFFVNQMQKIIARNSLGMSVYSKVSGFLKDNGFLITSLNVAPEEVAEVREDKTEEELEREDFAEELENLVLGEGPQIEDSAYNKLVRSFLESVCDLAGVKAIDGPYDDLVSDAFYLLAELGASIKVELPKKDRKLPKKEAAIIDLLISSGKKMTAKEVFTALSETDSKVSLHYISTLLAAKAKEGLIQKQVRVEEVRGKGRPQNEFYV